MQNIDGRLILTAEVAKNKMAKTIEIYFKYIFANLLKYNSDTLTQVDARVRDIEFAATGSSRYPGLEITGTHLFSFPFCLQFPSQLFGCMKPQIDLLTCPFYFDSSLAST